MHPFVECATFADDIKYNGGAWQSDFHFVDVPYVDQGQASDYNITTKSHYLTQGIQNISDWLSQKNGTDYLTSYMYTYINNNLYPGRPDLAQSYALRLLIHYMGDIHQPFHCESRFDTTYPDGDSGANLFPLPYHYSVDELHALMDKVLYVERNNIPRVSPLLSVTLLADVRYRLGHAVCLHYILPRHLPAKLLLRPVDLGQPRLRLVAD